MDPISTLDISDCLIFPTSKNICSISILLPKYWGWIAAASSSQSSVRLIR